MTRARLTAGRVQSFTCPEGKEQAFLRDSEVPGLALRVTAAGNRAYVFEGKLNRRTLRLTIGSPAHWTIETARARARELASLVDRGLDPRAELEKQRQEAEAARTRREAAEVCALEVWHAYCHERRDVWGERHYLDHLRIAAPGGEPRKKGEGVTQPGPLYALLNQPLASLTTEAVEAWAARNAHRPTQARLGLRLLKAFLNWCRTRPDFAQVLPAENPAHSRKARETLGTPKAKNDCLQREQLQPWFEKVRQQHPTVAAYLQTLLLTGARPGEVLALTWDAVDFQWLTLTIRDKVEGERVIPLTPYVARLLAALPRRNEWVFASDKASAPINRPGHAVERVCRLAGIPHVSLHGLRRSFGTLSEWVEAPVGVVAQLMGHRPSATAERHYRARPIDLLRKWHTGIEGWILEQAGIEQPPAEANPAKLRVVR
ncbi:site-specific integrase [Chloracidobacterium aggregatum]|uniref:Tyrosine-type recombinase/integrase n=1 Tax=Chloracidobacterium sp. N TaxID=2821540 RepID=A0ABX8B6X0_9BACT|nr:tyrosine-type recombinase/integrase [Chloracidobacterium aggregatum]QUV86547.1 tyrosine-type recombinase/integrase [Chloracidobacterium sp. 2]QUV92170.1 tyrosine-type recombinase/integrase [Chloracidobacterium sp. A]QUV95445.1 tyrosine-type recombinase/integrase [Chloracidobacterium sp. N]QUV98667.1 tyrosine-type recombinase/integrase [Chloracidobacterium sp. E]